MARLAWFSPMPPDPSGVAVNSAELVTLLGRRHEIDVFCDEPIARVWRHREASVGNPSVRSAHDFLWRRLRGGRSYDLTVYQLGNSSSHDFLWPYLFRFPGLTVLHDAHLHHARAAALLRQSKSGDYRDEFAAAHPDVRRNLAELAVAGFHNHLLYEWPMTALVVRASRLTAVHSPLLAEPLRRESPDGAVEAIRLGHGERISAARAAAARAAIRGRYGIGSSSLVFGVFGGLSPEKRLPQVLDAFAYLLGQHADAHLMLVGAPARHYDVATDVERRPIRASVILTGSLDEQDFTDHLIACDIVVNLRWPTAREMSGPWLRALAAGLPTITMDLAHTADVPALDPRSWTLIHTGAPAERIDPVTVAVDVLDEDHSLRLAMRGLAADLELRMRLSTAAAAYWEKEHSQERMVADYERVIQRAIETPDPRPPLPAHLTSDGMERLRSILAPFHGIDPWPA